MAMEAKWLVHVYMRQNEWHLLKITRMVVATSYTRASKGLAINFLNVQLLLAISKSSYVYIGDNIYKMSNLLTICES
jgi:hypothetical protein